jgi:hypothetical protein
MQPLNICTAYALPSDPEFSQSTGAYGDAVRASVRGNPQDYREKYLRGPPVQSGAGEEAAA